MTRHSYMGIVFSLGLLLSGCGLAHIRESVPTLKIEGQLVCIDKNRINNLKIVVPEFYGLSDAFLYFIEDGKDKWKPYEVKTAMPDTSGLFGSDFRREERYIGTMLPLFPSEKTRRSRHIFMRSSDSNLVYRIFLMGSKTEVYSTDINIAKSLYDQSDLKNKTPEERKDIKVISLITDFYRNIVWKRTDDISIGDIKRTQDMDEINLKISNCSS